MLARAYYWIVPSSMLLLAVTAVAACPKVASGLESDAPSPSVATVQDEIVVQPIEPEPEEVALESAVKPERPPCDGELDGAAMEKRANAYFLTGDVAGGVACLEEVMALDPQNSVARASLVKRYLDQNDSEKARVYAEELVRQEPLDASARQMLGRALMQERKWKEAIDAFALVVKTQPDNIYAHNNIGFSALQVGELELAREHLEHCLSLEPQQGYMLNNLGVAYERLGRPAEAHAAFSRAAELSPKYAQAQLNRDRLQARLGQDDRILSAETLLRFREPVLADDFIGDHSADSDEAPVGADSDPVDAAVDAATGAAGGSARMAPAAPLP